jgi:peptide/nickel transport system substrate-binding protein
VQSSSSVSQQQLVVDETQPPDSMDPAVEFTTAGNEITSNIYQGLVAPDLTSETAYVGQLASGWTTSADGMNWNFTLRNGVTFSNGDPFNAYVVWYSLYRSIIMNQPPSFILEQNFANSGGAVKVTAASLNSINFQDPSPTSLALMENSDQSFQVINEYEIALNLGLGYNGNVTYSALLATLTSPVTYAVDPLVVSAHAGVAANKPNTWMETNAIGTGFYLLSSPCNQCTSITLTKNSNYWGNGLNSSQLNYAIQPAIINNIIIYYKTVTATIADLKSGAAQMIGASDVSEIGGLNAIQGISGVSIKILPVQFGSAVGSYYIFLNPFIDSEFSNVLVREAVAYALDYQGIIHAIFDGYAQTWIGPIPPGFPNYNATTNGLSAYSYNDTIAANLLAQAGYQAKLNGATINPSGKVFPTLSFLYTPDISSEFDAAPVIESELSAIGINVNLVTLSFDQYTNYIFGTGTGLYGMGIGYYTEDYFASQDYVTSLAQDNFTGAPVILANESTFATNAAGATTNSTLIQAYQNVTTTMLNNYVLIWLYVPEQITVNYQNIAGMVPNPVGSCAGYFMYYSDVYYT